jgi:hypothetical protein
MDLLRIIGRIGSQRQPAKRVKTMQMRMMAAAAVIALAVTGCSKSESGASASSEPVKRQAGNWKTDIELVKFEMPGMPAEMKDGMAKMMEGASGMDQCLTAEQAAKEDLAKELSKGPGADGECTWSKKDVGGGKIDIAGKCKANGQEVQLAMAGTMEPTKTDVTITTKGAVPGGQGEMEMVMKMVSTRTGDCKAGTPTTG